MSEPTRTPEEYWYRVRPRTRRRPRVIVQPGRDADQSARSSRPSEAAGSERPEAKAGRKSAQRGREGRGEGQVDTADPVLPGWSDQIL